MKRVFFGVLAFLITGIFLFIIIQRFVGDLRPVLLPRLAQKNPVKAVTKGKPLSYALSIPSEFEIGIFAEGIGRVRDVVISPFGTVVASVPSKGIVIALPDENSDGVADEVVTLVSNLRNPHGLAFYENYLFIAEETQVSRYMWSEKKAAGGVIIIARLENVLFDLPAGGRHTTRSIAINDDGKLFVSLGSTCDVCIEKELFIGTVVVSDVQGKDPKVFARGLRNAVFLTIQPETQLLWGTEMGRDFLGDATPPDEVNRIQEGEDYGWPYCYGNKIYDTQFNKGSNSYCLKTVAPVYEVPAHSAPLGLTFINSSQFPHEWQGDILVAYHGSWNRSVPSGYKVVRLAVERNTIVGSEDFISGFLENNNAFARPVDLVFDQKGNLYLSEDKEGTIYIIHKK